MLVIVELSLEAFADARSLIMLATMAAKDELVLIGPHHAAADGAVPTLRRAMSGRKIVTLLADDGVAPHERELVKELLEAGHLPLILTSHDPAAELACWLGADARRALPDPAWHASRLLPQGRATAPL